MRDEVTTIRKLIWSCKQCQQYHLTFTVYCLKVYCWLRKENRWKKHFLEGYTRMTDEVEAGRKFVNLQVTLSKRISLLSLHFSGVALMSCLVQPHDKLVSFHVPGNSRQQKPPWWTSLPIKLHCNEEQKALHSNRSQCTHLYWFSVIVSHVHRNIRATH